MKRLFSILLMAATLAFTGCNLLDSEERFNKKEFSIKGQWQIADKESGELDGVNYGYGWDFDITEAGKAWSFEIVLDTTNPEVEVGTRYKIASFDYTLEHNSEGVLKRIVIADNTTLEVIDIKSNNEIVINNGQEQGILRRMTTQGLVSR